MFINHMLIRHRLVPPVIIVVIFLFVACDRSDPLPAASTTTAETELTTTPAPTTTAEAEQLTSPATELTTTPTPTTTAEAEQLTSPATELTTTPTPTTTAEAEQLTSPATELTTTPAPTTTAEAEQLTSPATELTTTPAPTTTAEAEQLTSPATELTTTPAPTTTAEAEQLLTAALLWEYPLSPNDYPSSTYRVVIDQGVAVVRIRDAEIHTLDAVSGQVLWRQSDTSPRADWLYRISDGVVYLKRFREPTHAELYANRGLTPTTDVLALDIRTGNKNWHSWDVPSFWFQRIFLSEEILVVESYPRIGLDIRTGKQLWEARVPGITNYAAGGVIYFQAADAVTAVDMTTGSILWRQELPGLAQIAGASDGTVFAAVSGSIIALGARTGNLAWTYQQSGRNLWFKGADYGVVVVESSMRHVGEYPSSNPLDEFCVLETETGSVLWCGERDGDFGGARLTDGSLQLDSRDRVALLDVWTGTELWGQDKEIDGARLVPRVLESDGVYYQVVHGEIAALDAASNSTRWRYTWDWDDDPSDWRDDPYLMAAADDVVILWTGAGLAAVGIPSIDD